jgi:hypothetical protein
MGSFMSGLVGQLGENVQRAADREYQEQKQERQQKMRLLELAGEAAVSKGLFQELPAIGAEMDELASSTPGWKSQAKGLPPDPFKALGTQLAQVLGLRKKQQQQQAALKAYAQLPDMPAAGGVLERLGPEIQQAEQAASEREFQTGRKRADIEAADVMPRKMAQVEQLVKGGMKREEAEAIAFGKQAAPAKPNVKEIQNVKGDAYGHPGEVGTLEVDLNTGKETFRATAPKPAGQGRIFTVNQGGHKVLYDATGKRIADLGPQDEPIQWRPKQIGNQVWYEPFSTRRHVALAPPQPALPEGEKAAQMPQDASKAGGRPPTPEMPPPSAPVARAAQRGGTQTTGAPAVTRPPGVTPGAVYGGEKYTAQQKTMLERTEVSMRTGVAAAQQLDQLPQQFPDWFGPISGRITEVQRKIGTAPPQIGGLLAQIHSIQNFLPSLHGLRGKYPLEAWERVLGDPFVNPSATANAIRGALKAAEEYRKAIQAGNFSEVVTVEDVERQKGGEGGGGGPAKPSQAATDYLKRRGIQ